MDININKTKDNKDRKNRDLLTKLEKYCSEDFVPMHMPGSKRNAELFSMENPYGIDITEIDGFDNLHHPQDIIEQAMLDAAKLFGAEKTLFLINGSSAGILSAICGATNRGDTILAARNCHISVYNAIYLNGLKPIYFQPECDAGTGIYSGVTIEEIRHALENNNNKENKKKVKAVVITSPTYEGYVSDIRKIAEYLHEKGIILIVDEAHGAHFNMSKEFPESAVSQGADLVIQSIHKTLPSLTQTALLHLNGNLINADRVEMYWNIYQTTSPSYILMGGIDRCLSVLADKGEVLFEEYTKKLKNLRKRLLSLKNICLLETDDISKIVLVLKNENMMNGKMLYDILLKEYHIQLEMASTRYVIAMTSIGDTDIYYERFANALEEIDGKINQLRKEYAENKFEEKQHLILKVQTKIDLAMTPFEAIENIGKNGGEFIDMNKSAGRICGAQVCMYPPGIPLVNPGERMTEEIIEILNNGINTGLEVMGLREGKILCLK